MTEPPSWLTVLRGSAPLLVSLPHTGTMIPAPYDRGLVSGARALKDTDWWIDRLYDFAGELGASVVHTAISRTVIDVNRDPTGTSLYPGQATTELCPTTTFDGEPLYAPGMEPDPTSIEERRERFLAPYHATIEAELDRLRASHGRVVLYDCHSIRSEIPRLSAGLLPQFNIGTAGGASCDPALAASIERLCDTSGLGWVLNGRFRGGFITRRFGRPDQGFHAVQMELSCRGYMREPIGPVGDDAWPVPYDPGFAAPIRATLTRILESCIGFAERG